MGRNTNLNEIAAVNDLNAVSALQLLYLLGCRLHYLYLSLVRLLYDVGQTAHDATTHVDDVTLIG